MNCDCVCVFLVFVNLQMSMHFDIFSCNFVKLKYIKKCQDQDTEYMSLV